MRSGFFWRVLALATAGVLATATITLAASKRLQAPKPARTHVVHAPARPPLVVPDVRGQAYVFAKGILDDSGFAWRVVGKNGFAANTVVSQRPAPGTRVVDTGAPLVTLALRGAKRYAQKGTPENVSPFDATPLRLVAPVGADGAADALRPQTRKHARPARHAKPAR